jgi:hypothetical protein
MSYFEVKPYYVHHSEYLSVISDITFLAKELCILFEIHMIQWCLNFKQLGKRLTLEFQ